MYASWVDWVMAGAVVAIIAAGLVAAHCRRRRFVARMLGHLDDHVHHHRARRLRLVPARSNLHSHSHAEQRRATPLADPGRMMAGPHAMAVTLPLSAVAALTSNEAR